MSTKKTGVFTISLGLILSGVLMILHQNDLVSAQVFSYIWPLLIILFGLEIIWNRLRQPDQQLQMSGWSITLIILVFLISLSQSITPASFFWQNKYYSAVYGEMPVDGTIKQVDIRIPEGKVIITGTDKAVLSYHGELATRETSQSQADENIKANWKVRKAGDTIELILEQPTTDFSLSQLFQWGLQQPALNVDVPQALLTKVQTKNGKIDIQDMNAGVELKTSNGAISVQNVHGHVKAETSNGSQTIEDIAGAVEIQTNNGTVTFSNISGAFSAESSNGLIKGESAVNGNWDLRTSNGKIDITLPENTNAAIQGKTSNGNFNGNIRWQDEGKNNRSSILGTGANKISLSTSNGSITVDMGY